MLTDIIAGIIEGFYLIIDKIMHRDVAKESVKEHIIKNEFIQERITNLRKSLKADRVRIMQYHNGGYYFSGLPMQKYSCTYEAVGYGIASELEHYQNKLVSETSFLHSNIIKEKEYFINDVDSLEEGVFKQKLVLQGIKSQYVIGVWDIRDNLIGLVAISYIVEKREVPTFDKVIIADFAKLISGYLTPQTDKDQRNNWSVATFLVFLFFTVMSQAFFVGFDLFCLFKYIILHH